MNDDEKISEHERAVIRATIKEFMDQIYQTAGKSLLERMFWIAVGVLLFWYFGGHWPK